MIVIHLFVAIALIIVVLLQRSEGGALGMGGVAGSAMEIARILVLSVIVLFLVSVIRGRRLR